MAQERGESKHKERFVQRQRNAARPNKAKLLTSSIGCSPLDSSSCDIPDHLQSTQHPAQKVFGQNFSDSRDLSKSSPLHFLPA